MSKLTEKALLSKTNSGIDIYAHILRVYYPNQTVLSLVGRTCSPTRNPFNEDKPTLQISIVQKPVVCGEWFGECCAMHIDTDNAINPGTVFDFATLHYGIERDELLTRLNEDLHLHIGEKFDFYANARKSTMQYTQNEPEAVPFVPTEFSYFKAPVTNTKPFSTLTIPEVYNLIKGNKYAEATTTLRSIADVNEARKYKAAHFDYVTFSGEFTTRNDKNLVKHSGLIVIDFDHLSKTPLSYGEGQGGEVWSLRQALLADEYFDTELLFTSPSGDGLKWVIQISPPLGDLGGFSQSDFFAAVAYYISQTYHIEVDKSGKDISRACFLVHDPNVYINPKYNLNHE